MLLVVVLVVVELINISEQNPHILFGVSQNFIWSCVKHFCKKEKCETFLQKSHVAHVPNFGLIFQIEKGNFVHMFGYYSLGACLFI